METVDQLILMEADVNEKLSNNELNQQLDYHCRIEDSLIGARKRASGNKSIESEVEESRVPFRSNMKNK